MIGDEGLRQAIRLIPEWLRHQKWFSGDRSGEIEVRPVSATLLAEQVPRVWHLLVEVRQGAVRHTYQVPLSIRQDWVDRLDYVHLGRVGSGQVYDGLYDKEAAAIILGHFADGGRQVGDMSFHVQDKSTIPFDEQPMVLPGEHHNTSLAYGDVGLLKVFRHIQPGVNADVEIHEALARADCTLVAPLLGWIDGTWHDPDDGTSHQASLAMLQGFLTTASDGWGLAEASVRDLYAEADLRANEVGGDFAAESYRLGMSTARVHETMAEVLPTAVWDAAELTTLTDAMLRRLDDALQVVPELEPHTEGLRKHFFTLPGRGRPVKVQRIHGTYHLGQVLRTVIGWKLIDFEGESMLSTAQRRALNSPLRDVAGMLRSYDYVARHLLLSDHTPEDADYPQLIYRAEEWVRRNSEAFCAGYAAASHNDPREDLDLLLAYEADQAVYEIVQEAKNRPSWLQIPLSAIARLSALS